MNPLFIILIALLALALGLLAGWLLAARRAGGLARELAVAQTRAGDADLHRTARDAVQRERNEARDEHHQALGGELTTSRSDCAAVDARAAPQPERVALQQGDRIVKLEPGRDRAQVPRVEPAHRQVRAR